MYIGALPLLWLVIPLSYAAEDLGLLTSDTSPLTRIVRQLKGCSKNEYTCSNGECVDAYQVCDGEKNCRDGTDETQAACLGLQCPAFAFRCAYGACVDRNVRCDGKQDCADNSDELLPECLTGIQRPPKRSTCKKDEFACYSGQCVNEYAVCDGNTDCNDGSDETITQCVNIRCPSFSFQCAYGACIEASKKCNGQKDCSDGSDEDEELCEYTTNVVGESRPSSSVITLVTTGRPTTLQPIAPTAKPRGSCPLPEKEKGSHYKIEGCPGDNCRGDVGSWVPEFTLLTYTCDPGYALPLNKNITFCRGGAWQPEEIKCQKMCKPLFSDSMDLECQYLGMRVPCHYPALPATKVRPKCKTAFHVQDPSTAFKETYCTEEGKWESPLFKCVADCGKASFNVGKPLITFGSPTVVGEYPWHAGLYLKKRGVFEHSCGGTIIHPYIILTAAHCVYNDSAQRSIFKEMIQVAVGKYTRTWEVRDPHEQRIAVSDIILQRAYRGLSNSYEQDIAALELTNSISLSNIVLPACIDWTAEGILTVGMLGTVVGWGVDENDRPSEVLKTAKLPYMDFATCRKRSPEPFLRFITYDKFCAGADNGTSVQQGDSGGGITFVRNNLYFLYGIVSIKPLNINSFAAYTNVMDHIDWLQGVVTAIKARHTY